MKLFYLRALYVFSVFTGHNYMVTRSNNNRSQWNQIMAPAESLKATSGVRLPKDFFHHDVCGFGIGIEIEILKCRQCNQGGALVYRLLQFLALHHAAISKHLTIQLPTSLIQHTVTPSGGWQTVQLYTRFRERKLAFNIYRQRLFCP